MKKGRWYNELEYALAQTERAIASLGWNEKFKSKEAEPVAEEMRAIVNKHVRPFVKHSPLCKDFYSFFKKASTAQKYGFHFDGEPELVDAKSACERGIKELVCPHCGSTLMVIEEFDRKLDAEGKETSKVVTHLRHKSEGEAQKQCVRYASARNLVFESGYYIKVFRGKLLDEIDSTRAEVSEALNKSFREGLVKEMPVFKDTSKQFLWFTKMIAGVVKVPESKLIIYLEYKGWLDESGNKPRALRVGLTDKGRNVWSMIKASGVAWKK